MTRLVWDETGSRFFEAGVDRGVFYTDIGTGIPWNGLISVDEAPSDSEVRHNHVDGIKFRNKVTRGSFSGAIRAFTYPRELEEHEGISEGFTSQRRKEFGLSYRTRIGNDLDDVDHGYRIHIVYNVLAKPSPVNFDSMDDAIDAVPFSWDFTTKPVNIPGALPASHLIIDTRYATELAVKNVEDVLYGSDTETPRLPTPIEVIDLVNWGAVLVIVDHGDGTWSAIGPDEAIQMIDDYTFEITWPSAIYLDENTYQISSL